MIVTITGPRSVGKSTIAKLVAKKLNLRYVSSDEIGDKALKKEGGLDLATKSGAIYKFIQRDAYSLIRAQYKNDDFVFDLSGGSISSRRVPEVSEKVRKIAKSRSIVVGLLPYEDHELSIKYLFARERNRAHFQHLGRKELKQKTEDDYMKFPPIFKEFCDILIYTKKRTPEDIAKEIVRSIKAYH